MDGGLGLPRPYMLNHIVNEIAHIFLHSSRPYPSWYPSRVVAERGANNKAGEEMSKVVHYRGKYEPWVWISWLLFSVSAIASVVVINKFGSMEMPVGGYVTITKQAYNVPLIAAAIGQSAVMLLTAGAFTILNGTYNAVIEKVISND